VQKRTKGGVEVVELEEARDQEIGRRFRRERPQDFGFCCRRIREDEYPISTEAAGFLVGRDLFVGVLELLPVLLEEGLDL
jgi:hypothetical protein